MSRSNREECYKVTLRWEKGYSNHPRDTGGSTLDGVTQARYDEYRRDKGLFTRDVRESTEEERSEIWLEGYWYPVRGDELPFGFDLCASDGAFNSGVSRGAKWVQKAVGSRVDGKIGLDTITRAFSSDYSGISRACEYRMGFLRALSNWDAFGRGWSNRVADVQAVATRMWLKAYSQNVNNKLDNLAKDADYESSIEESRGKKQAGGVATAGGGSVVAGDQANLPIEALILMGLFALTIAAIVTVRARRRAKYKRDLAEAFRREVSQ